MSTADSARSPGSPTRRNQHAEHSLGRVGRPAGARRRRCSRRPPAAAPRRPRLGGGRRRAGVASRPRRGARPAAPRSPSPAARPASPATSRSAGTAASAAATRRSRSPSRRRSSRRSTPPPRHPPDVRGRPVRRRPRRARDADRVRATARTSSARWASAAPNAFHGQWLDLPPLIDKTDYDMSSSRSRRSTSTTSAARARSASRSRSTRRSLFYKAEPVQGGRPRRAAARVGRQVHDARRLAWSPGTTTRSARSRMILTVDKNGKDATQAGFDPENIVQWGFEPQRDDLRQARRLLAAGTLVGAPTARPPRSRTPGRPPGSWFYDGIWKDHISDDRARSSRARLQPRRTTRSSPARSR